METPESQAQESQRFAGVPKRYHGLTVSSLVAHAAETLAVNDSKAYIDAVNAAVTYWSCPKRSVLVLHGSAGSGKTALGAALLGTVPMHEYPGFITARVCTDELRERNETTLRALLNRVGVFMLDDLGSEYATYYSNAALDALIDEVYMRGIPTIITTNLTQSGIAEAYSERMLDRLSEDSQWVAMNGPSFRRL